MTRLEEIEARKAEIRSEVETTEDIEKVEELEKETDALNKEVAEIEEQEKNEEVAEELEEKSFEAKEVEKEERKMEKTELRNSKEYINAYAEYIKTGKDEEVRSLLTENVNGGTIAVPDFVLDEVKTAWDNNDLLSLVRKTNVPGNLKVQFEISGTDAVIHTEGSGAVAEEELVEGIVELKPASIKKWISISDEVMDMRGEEFLRYIYDELTYRIAKKAADELIDTIAGLQETASSSAPSAAKISLAPEVGTVAAAYGNLSDEASDITIVMNKLTYADFKRAQYENNYAVDPFEGFRVRFNNELPSYSSADPGEVYMIVGDLGHGAIANFPNGEGISIKVDELSRKKEDLVEILGREYVAIGVVADKSFVNVVKPSE